MSIFEYNAFIRFFGVDGKTYSYRVEDAYLVACRRGAKLYVRKAVQDGNYAGGFIRIRYPSLGKEFFVEVEQWVFEVIDKDGYRMPKISRSDVETVEKMEKARRFLK